MLGKSKVTNMALKSATANTDIRIALWTTTLSCAHILSPRFAENPGLKSWVISHSVRKRTAPSDATDFKA